MFRKECPGYQPQRSDIAERTDVKKGPSSQPIDHPKSYKCEHQIGDADSDRLQQGCFRCQSRPFKDPRGKIENGIDPGHLIKECNQNGQKNRPGQSAAPKTS